MGMRSAFLLGLAGLLWMTCAQAWPRVDAQLNAAATAGDVAAIDRAIADGANPDQARALAAAVAAKHRKAVDDLLQHHADPNAWARGSAYALSGPEGSPVFEAAKLGDREILLDLVHHGADLNAASRWGYMGDTPLAFAVRNGQVGAVRLLIDAGADVNHPGANGETPLRNAFYGEPNAVEIVQLLLAHGADPDIKDSQGKTARQISYGYGPAAIRSAIERAKPPPPFTRPEDVQSIYWVLLCRAAEGAMRPGYLASTRTEYANWRAPRAATITKIESTAEFHNSLARVLQEVTSRADSHGQGPSDESANDGEIESQCDLALPAELAPAHPSPAVELQRVRAVLICKATYDVLIPGYKARTQVAYSHWRADHRSDLAQIESSLEFREERAEALRELTPLGSGPVTEQVASTTSRAVTACERSMPADLRAPVEPLRNSGGAVLPSHPAGSLESSAGSTSLPAAQASGTAPEEQTPAPGEVPVPPTLINQASAKVKFKQVIRSAPTAVGGAVSPPQPH